MTRDEYKKQMRAEMERDIRNGHIDPNQILVRSTDRTYTCLDMMKEVEAETRLGVQLLDSFIGWQKDPAGDFPDVPEGVKLAGEPEILDAVLENDVREEAASPRTRDEYKQQMLDGLAGFSPTLRNNLAMEHGGKTYTYNQLMEEVNQGTPLGELTLSQFITYCTTGKFLRVPGETTDWLTFDEDEPKQLN